MGLALANSPTPRKGPELGLKARPPTQPSALCPTPAASFPRGWRVKQKQSVQRKFARQSVYYSDDLTSPAVKEGRKEAEKRIPFQ